MSLFYQPEIPEGSSFLDEGESHHAVKVLRLKPGDPLELTDGKGGWYQATITEAHHKRCRFEVTGSARVPPYPMHRHIAIAPTKHTDRMEWFVEKAVELGVDRISFILCEHAERSMIKTDRIQKKAISAMKQSLKAYLPEVHEMVSFSAFLKAADAEARFIAHADPSGSTHLKEVLEKKKSSLILIGPEGDFSTGEVRAALNAGFQKVSLGRSRLRTETAGIAAVHLLNLA